MRLNFEQLRRAIMGLPQEDQKADVESTSSAEGSEHQLHPASGTNEHVINELRKKTEHR